MTYKNSLFSKCYRLVRKICNFTQPCKDIRQFDGVQMPRPHPWQRVQERSFGSWIRMTQTGRVATVGSDRRLRLPSLEWRNHENRQIHLPGAGAVEQEQVNRAEATAQTTGIWAIRVRFQLSRQPRDHSVENAAASSFGTHGADPRKRGSLDQGSEACGLSFSFPAEFTVIAYFNSAIAPHEGVADLPAHQESQGSAIAPRP